MDDADTVPCKGTTTHPYVATISIDPADWRRFERDFADRPEFKILKVDRRTPDYWAVYMGCASQRVQDDPESNQ
jgi:hypothetical protein